VGDTLWAESEILETRASKSNPDVGLVSLRTRGINQRGETVVEFRRTFMAYRRTSPQARGAFPEPASNWTV
jgi:acyl dehydratase